MRKAKQKTWIYLHDFEAGKEFKNKYKRKHTEKNTNYKEKDW